MAIVITGADAARFKDVARNVFGPLWGMSRIVLSEPMPWTHRQPDLQVHCSPMAEQDVCDRAKALGLHANKVNIGEYGIVG